MTTRPTSPPKTPQECKAVARIIYGDLVAMTKSRTQKEPALAISTIKAKYTWETPFYAVIAASDGFLVADHVKGVVRALPKSERNRYA